MFAQGSGVQGRVLDPQGKVVARNPCSGAKEWITLQETLAPLGGSTPIEQVVGVRLSSYGCLSCTYHFGEKQVP